MEYKILGVTYHEDEIGRLILLRSQEWEALPVFSLRGVAPMILLWFPWWQVCLAFVAASFIWCPIRTRCASFSFAMLICKFSNIYVSVIMNVLIAAYFFYEGKVAIGVLALLWHFVSTILAFAYPPSGVPDSLNKSDEAALVPASIIQEKFRNEILESYLQTNQ